MTATADGQSKGLIIVGCDGSRAGEAAMDFAVAEAVRRDSRLTVVAAYDFPANTYASLAPVSFDYGPEAAKDTTTMAEACLDAALKRAGGPTVKHEVVVREGRPSVVLLEAALDADLLIIGARGVGMWERLMTGSTCTEVVHHSAGPVVVVPCPQP